jgi:hypothetical protein
MAGSEIRRLESDIAKGMLKREAGGVKRRKPEISSV